MIQIFDIKKKNKNLKNDDQEILKKYMVDSKMDNENILKRYNSNINGLTSNAAKKRLNENGKNVVE